MRRGDIYYANLDPVIGSEQGGIRPVVVIQNNVGNHYSPTTIVAAITSKDDKAKVPTHVKVKVEGLSRTSIILLEQIRTIDKSRLRSYVNTLTDETMGIVDAALAISVDLRKGA